MEVITAISQFEYVELPVSDLELPVSDLELPVSDLELPVRDLELPVRDLELPVSDFSTFKNLYVLLLCQCFQNG